MELLRNSNGLGSAEHTVPKLNRPKRSVEARETQVRLLGVPHGLGKAERTTRQLVTDPTSSMEERLSHTQATVVRLHRRVQQFPFGNCNGLASGKSATSMRRDGLLRLPSECRGYESRQASACKWLSTQFPVSTWSSTSHGIEALMAMHRVLTPVSRVQVLAVPL